VRVVKARIAYGRGVDQGRDFSEVFGAELVKDADVRIFELSEELDGTYRTINLLSSLDQSITLSTHDVLLKRGGLGP
jgi:hypothetical protein